MSMSLSTIFFFFHDTASTEIYTLSLHDALPILTKSLQVRTTPRVGESSIDPLYGRYDGMVDRLTWENPQGALTPDSQDPLQNTDRKSTRLNSSHVRISYAVFCLKKKSKQ